MMRTLAIMLLGWMSLAAAETEWLLPKGYRVEEFARVVDPVAMDWDGKGRVWVLESSGRIKIIDGETKIFAEGLEGATGLALRGDNVYVARAPELLLLRGTDREVVITNLPQSGARGNINSLRLGPDGWLYFTQGAQDEAEFYRFGIRAGDPQLISSGVARFHPETKRLEMVADGMVFPRGLAFDEAGELFAADSSRNHLFQVFPGVSYQRPLSRDYLGHKPPALGAIADHRFLEGEFFGMTIYRGMVLLPNLREKSVHLERLEAKGATHRARCDGDFLRRTVGDFQPVDLREGPDGALWILDRAGTDARNPFKLAGKGKIWRVVPSEKWETARPTEPELVKQRKAATECRALMLGTVAPGIPEPHSVSNTHLIEVVKTVLDAAVKDADAAMEAVLWSALEPLLAWDATATLRMFQTLEARDAPAACSLFQHAIRRAFGASYEEHVPNIYPLLVELANQSVPLCLAGLEGTIQGQKTSKRYHRFDKSFRKVIKALTDTQQPELVAGSLQAGALCGYADSRAELVRRMLDANLNEAERLQAVQFAQVLRDEPAREALLELLEKPALPNLTLAAAFSLKEIGRVGDVDVVLRAATRQKPEVQLALGRTIAERRDWMASLGQQVRAQRLDPATLPPPLREKLR